MTKRLILMRHAKSSWESPALGDHARPLNGRGRKSAQAVGDWLRIKNYLPDQALISSSARTRETFARLGHICDATFQDSLYHGGPEHMFKELQKVSGNCILLLGHNPGTAWLARDIVATPPDHPRFHDYPTCATLVADFAIDAWADLKPGYGQVVDFVIPRELTD